MARTESQRQLLAAYKQRPIVGGVCAIRCPAAGRTLLLAAPNPEGQRNRFAFSVSTGACVHAALARDWRVFGADSFTFEVLETLERGPGQTDAAFRADLEILRDIWRDKLTAEGAALYH